MSRTIKESMMIYSYSCKECGEDTGGAMFCSLDCFEEYKKNPPAPKEKTVINNFNDLVDDDIEVIGDEYYSKEEMMAWKLALGGDEIAEEARKAADEEAQKILEENANDFVRGGSSGRMTRRILTSKERDDETESLIRRLFPQRILSDSGEVIFV